jgi:long-chain acyl-CoA synthetase
MLLTGVTGFLGGEVLARLLERDEETVYALIRARDGHEAETRLDEVLEGLFGDAGAHRDRVVAVRGDLERPGLGMDQRQREWLAERVDRIVHCAASVSFTLGLDESRRVNVDGTRWMLELAELCARRGGLSCFTHVSTAYVAGDIAELFTEAQLDVGQRFRNAYERSKFEAEQLVRRHGGSIPVQVLRPSIIVGDSRTGWTPAFNVLYWPLRAFTKGVLPILPARRSSAVDVVPVDYVADAIVALAGQPWTTYHLTASRDASSVDELIELGTTYLDRRPPRVVPPALYRGAVHPVLVRTGSRRRRKALRRTEAFFPYFSMRVRYDDELARSELGQQGIAVPRLRDYFDRLMDFAIEADWGRNQLPRQAPAEGAPTPSRRRAFARGAA